MGLPFTMFWWVYEPADGERQTFVTTTFVPRIAYEKGRKLWGTGVCLPLTWLLARRYWICKLPDGAVASDQVFTVGFAPDLITGVINDLVSYLSVDQDD